MLPSPVPQTGVFNLIIDTGIMAKFVLLILFFSSVLCWGIIFTKWKILKRALKLNSQFLDFFWHSESIEEILVKVDRYTGSPVAAMFKSGAKELRKISSTSFTNPKNLDNIHRALIRTSYAEMATLEKHLGWLATTASAAPFVGLFGTVWGIMHSFQNIGLSGVAHLAVVAPGISEALITTATGIAAAIPAVVAYNHFAGQIKRVATEAECFIQDFVNIVQRSLLSESRLESALESTHKSSPKSHKDEQG